MKKEPEEQDKNIVENMTAFQLSRWIALFDGINIVADKAEKDGRRFNFMHIKQPALEEYVDRTSVLIYREITGKELR